MARLGSMTLVSWMFTTVGSLFLAFVFSRMSVLIPKTGGPYTFAHAGLGNALGFQTAYTYWINAWVGNAAIALGGMGALSAFFPGLANPKIACFTSIAVIWVFTLINLRGVYAAGVVQLVTTIMKLAPIFFIAIFGWFFFHVEYITQSANVTQPHLSTFDLITQGATLTLWAFIGLECATVPADSVKNPKRTIPIATILGMSIAAVCYIAGSVVIMGMLPNAALQHSISPFADAAQIIFGNWGKWLVAFGVGVACLGALNGWILIQGQIPMAAADDHLFLRIFGRRNKKCVPHYGLIIGSALTSALLLLTISPDFVDQYKLIILLATIAALISYLYTPVAELVMIRQGLIPFSRKVVVFSTVAILYAFWAIMGAGTEVLAYGALLILSSIPLYIFVARRVTLPTV